VEDEAPKAVLVNLLCRENDEAIYSRRMLEVESLKVELAPASSLAPKGRGLG
jgi:hypothetical protein